MTSARTVLSAFLIILLTGCGPAPAPDSTAETPAAASKEPLPTPGEPDATRIHADIERIWKAFVDNTPEVIVETSYPALVELSGGHETMLNVTRNVMKSMHDQGLEIESRETGAISPFYPSNVGAVAFVPTQSIMRVGPQRLEVHAYTVAIQGKEQWSYLDSSGFRDHPENLYSLIPGLSREIPLPPNTVRVLEP